MGKLINRISGSRLMTSSLSGSAPRTLVELRGLTISVTEALPGKLDFQKTLT